jgi:hypothetical protein
MNLTNRLNLPQPIFEAVRNDGYTKGDADISVTGLLRPPRIGVLEDKYQDKIEEDVSERIWSLMGQAIHTILERANATGVAERRLSATVEGWKISGGMDLVHSGSVLSDYKVTSIWAVKEGVKPEWVQQLNIYRWLLFKHGEQVDQLEAVVILRDWSKNEAGRDPYYPQAQVVRMSIPVWDLDKTEAFVRERVILHKQARLSLPECSPEDRWAKPDVWAVMRKGLKRAVKLCSTEGEARALVGFDKELSVVHRPGQSTRCLSYCRVAFVCSQWRQMQNSTQNEDANVSA